MSSRFKTAEERLDKAMARVDAAAVNPANDRGSGARLVALENENQELRTRHSEIAGRLDQAIDRLQRILQAR